MNDAMKDGAKRAAGLAAAGLVQPGMLVGLGSGSTMRHAVDALGARWRDGLRFTGVATSTDIAAQAAALGIALADPDAPIDLAIDGADEVERGSLRLIKGLGGALLREKIVAENSHRFVIVADEGKLVDRLGAHAPLPVEISVFGHAATTHRVAALGGAPVLRQHGGVVFVTDGGNWILDCAGFAPIRDPFTLERSLRAIAGVLGTGLFLGPVEQVLLGQPNGSLRVIRPGEDRA